MIRDLAFRAEKLFDEGIDRVRRHPVVGEIYEIGDGSIGDYARDHGPMYAGALAFYAILSLIPLVILLASAAGFTLAGDADADAAVQEVVAQLRKIIPYIEPSFADDLKKIIENRKSIGVIGAFALLYSSSEVFRALEFALARIFARADHEPLTDDKAMPRNYFISKLIFSAFFTSVILGYVLLRLIIGVLKHATVHIPIISDLAANPLSSDTFLGRAVTAGMIIIGFVIALKLFTHHKVHTRFAIAGGVLFYVLFTLATVVYDIYLSKFASIGATYGSFATLIIVVLWIYFSASLLLFCCHLVKAVQRRLLHGPRWPKDGKLLV
jgi:membrane protein